MKKIYKVKHICSVPGCACVDCLSLSRGSNGSVCLCKKCIADLYHAMTGESKQKKESTKKADETTTKVRGEG